MEKKKIIQTTIASISVLAVMLVCFKINSQAEAAVINKSKSSNFLRNGLVGWWTFDGGKITSTGALDSGPSALNATRTGTKVTAGKIGQGLKLNGTSSDYITLPATGDYNVRGNMGFASNEDWSVSVWYQGTDTTQNTDFGVSLVGWNNGNLFAALILRNGYPEFIHYNGGWQHNIAAANRVVDGKWHNVTYVNHSDNTGSLYIDGIVQVQRASSTINLPTGGTFFQPYHIGAQFNNVYTRGKIDDVRIYNRSLSPAEALGLYTAGGGKINKTDLIRAQLRSGLKAHWTFDGADTTTNTSTDTSGNGNNGTRTGTKVAAGKIGQGLKFNGTSDIISTTLNGFPASTSDVTVSFWAKPQNNNSDLTFILVAATDENSNRFSITLPYSSVIYWDFGDITGAGRLNVNMNASWLQTMAFWTFTSETGVGQKIYRNGVVIASDSTASTFTKGTKSLNIGAFTTSTQWWKGILDDLRIYNRALSSAEISQLYAMGRVKINKTDTIKPVLKNSLVGHWTFDGGDMTSITSTDKSGRGNHGTSTVISAIRGKIGQALNFKDSNYFVNLGDPSSLRLTTQFTISSWIKVRAHKNYNQVFMKNDANTDFYGLVLDANGNLTGQVGNGGSSVTLVGNSVLSTNKWYHVAATYNSALASGNLKLYINGVEETYVGNGNFTSGVGDTTGGYTNIAKDPVNGRNFDGSLDDVRVYSRPLAPAEIMALYKTGK